MIHGLAFATILSNLHLDSGKFVLSLLGFNIGIELMQIFVILIVMPWFLLLSPFKIYKWVRIVGASLAGIAAIAWMIERYTGKPNFISLPLQNSADYGIFVVMGLAVFTMTYLLSRKLLKK